MDSAVAVSGLEAAPQIATPASGTSPFLPSPRAAIFILTYYLAFCN